MHIPILVMHIRKKKELILVTTSVDCFEHPSCLHFTKIYAICFFYVDFTSNLDKLHCFAGGLIVLLKGTIFEISDDEQLPSLPLANLTL